MNSRKQNFQMLENGLSSIEDGVISLGNELGDKIEKAEKPKISQLTPEHQEFQMVDHGLKSIAKALKKIKPKKLKDGSDGKDGRDGLPGKTPVKGVDYFTPEEQAIFVNDILNSIKIPLPDKPESVDYLKVYNFVVSEIAKIPKPDGPEPIDTDSLVQAVLKLIPKQPEVVVDYPSIEKFCLEAIEKIENQRNARYRQLNSGGPTTRISEISDVDITGLSTGQVLSWNGRAWVPTTLAAGSTPPSIGGTITSGTPGSVLFVGGGSAAPTFAQNPQYFQYDQWASNLQVTSTLGGEIVSGAWTLASGWTGHTTTGPWTHGSDGTGTVSKTVGVTDPFIGNLYLITFSISSWTVGSVSITWGGVTLVNPVDGTTVFGADGTYNVRMKATATTTSFVITPTNTARLTISLPSVKKLSGGTIRTGYLDIWSSGNNSTPGTTRHISLNNDGQYSYIDANFSGVLKGSIGFASTGSIYSYQAGSVGWNYYYGTIVSPLLFAQNLPTTFYHIGMGQFGNSVIAGSTTTPTSTLQSAGSFAAKVARYTTNTTLTASTMATKILLDGTSNSSCIGTPTFTCSHWTNQTDCEKWDFHGGPCSWYAGASCSAFNNEFNMGTCIGTSGCSADTSSCNSANNTDQATCEALDDTYGGPCGWDTSTCPAQTSTSACNAISGCSATLGGDCNTLSDGGGDGTNCATQPECSYDSGSGVCSGNYFTSCSGDLCTGTYYTGNCSGTYGAACSGTSTCTGIDDSTNCGNESGCTWTAAISLTLPNITLVPDRDYWITNDSSTGIDATIYPHSGGSPTQTINGASSEVLANYKQGIHISPYALTAACSGLANEAACLAKSECTAVYTPCTWSDPTCSGNAACAAGTGTNQATCEAITYYTSCSGNYTSALNWHIFA